MNSERITEIRITIISITLILSIAFLITLMILCSHYKSTDYQNKITQIIRHEVYLKHDGIDELIKRYDEKLKKEEK